MNILDELTKRISAAFEASGYAPEYGRAAVSNRPDLCDYQCNGALTAAKQYRKSPLQIAGEVAEKLKDDEAFESVEAVPPGFINICIAGETLSRIMQEMLADERLLLPQMERRTIVVDYGGPNIAKPLHVGHLRSAIIGDSICRLARFLGHEVIGDIHLGDWGLQMGLVIAECRRLYPELVFFDEGYEGEYPEELPFGVDDLSKIYPEASVRSKADEAFAAQAAEATVQLQDGRRGYYAFWQRVRALSVGDLKKSYDILGVHFDKWLGESDADPYIPKVLDILKEKNLLRESEGAMVVDVERPDDKEPMPPMLIVKSNGGDIYGTTDLGTILQRMQDWKPQDLWYVVDNRQALHFKQVFRVAEKAGILQDTQCTHIGFGTMNGKDGKPYKTRDGGVMRLSDMIDMVTENAYKVTESSSVEMSDKDRRRAAQTIGVAAMKVGDMLNHRSKDYVFDLERFMATEGKTGPYLQYTAVRIRSVLQKAASSSIGRGAILPPITASERDLMLGFLAVPEALNRAFADKAPNVICEQLFDLSGRLNRFYSENKILIHADEDRRGSWLSLLRLTYLMLEILLDLLGIGIPASM